jgi:hypothetical protein
MKLIFDLPIIGGIIESFTTYFSTLFQLVAKKNRFIHSTDATNRKKSMQFFELGLVVGFLFLVPFFIKFGSSPSKFIFIVRQVIGILIYSYFLSLAFEWRKVKRNTFMPIITIMGYIWGLLFPLNFIILLPLLLNIGPDFLFHGADNSWVSKLDNSELTSFVWTSSILGLIFIAIWLYYVIPWLKHRFNLTTKQTIITLLLGGLPAGIIQGYVVSPLFVKIEEVVSNWLMIF